MLRSKHTVLFFIFSVVWYRVFKDYFPTSAHKRYLLRNTHNNRTLQDEENILDYNVEWTINLGGKDSLLESDYLKAGLERSIKEFINNDIKCSNELNSNLESASFFGIEINLGNSDSNKLKRISGNGKCRGNRTRCKKKIKKSISDAGKTADTNISYIAKKDDFCAAFQGTSIFDIFNSTLALASAFHYNVDLELINDLSGSLDLNYIVTFEEEFDGLNEIENVDIEPDDPVPVTTICTDDLCDNQASIIHDIFTYFNIPFDKDEDVCLYESINCNLNDNLVSHIWLENYAIIGKTIPEKFGQLESLKGLFLGGNELVGTIPSNFGFLKKLKLLWLQDNSLTGRIPSQLGNIRGLKELNLGGNSLTGTIPSDLGKLKNLRLMNLGKNKLSGSIPAELGTTSSTTISTDEGCVNFQDPFQDILGSRIFSKLRSLYLRQTKHLQILSLYENSLTGSIPEELAGLTSLVDLNLAGNRLAGRLPKVFGNMNNLVFFDVRDNKLSGSIPPEIGDLNSLEVLNLYRNRFEKSIPTSIGMMRNLQELILDGNRLTSAIPTEIGNLITLKYLSFSGNKMSGMIPTEIGKLVSLNNLDIRDYSIIETSGKVLRAGTIPTELGNLKNWRFVVFSNNGVQGTLPSEFGALASAEAVWLRNQKLSGSLPAEIGNLNALSLFSVGINNFEGSIPRALAGMRNLVTLDLASNDFSGNIPEEFSNISKLDFMGLDDNFLSGTIPSSIQNLTALAYVNLTINNFSGSIPSEIGELSSLQVFSAFSNAITGVIPSEIGELSELTNLNIGNNQLTGTIPSELGNVDLQVLDLGSNSLTGSIPEEVLAIESLEIVELSGNDITGDYVEPSHENLTFFNVEGNYTNLGRWLCSSPSLDSKQNELLNCPNYCGTDDEECNSNDIGDALCLDVGCSLGTPTCTSTCRLDYTSCNPNENELSFKLQLQTVAKGWQTKWTIQDDFSVIWQSNATYNNFDSDIVEYRCLPISCFKFELIDTGGDGICCGEDETDFGGYQIVDVEKEITGTNPNFGSSVTYFIGSCSNSPSFAPSISLKPSISSSPSRLQGVTSIPTQLPTHSPSSLTGTPTISILPTIDQNPTTSPSNVPSQPSSSTNSPTNSPTNPPTNSPTISVSPTQSPSFSETQVSLVEDTYIEVNDDSPNGSSSQLKMNTEDHSMSLLKFNLGPPFPNANSKFMLSMKLANVDLCDTRLLRVRKLQNNISWQEQTATFSNSLILLTDTTKVGSMYSLIPNTIHGLFQIGATDFYISKKSLTWNDHFTEAQTYGMTLASIRNEVENDIIIQYMSEQGIAKLWTGGNHLPGIPSFWEWKDGSDFLYTDWKSGEPSNEGGVEDKIEITQTGWNDQNENDKNFAIYSRTTQSSPGPSPTLSPAPTPSFSEDDLIQIGSSDFFVADESLKWEDHLDKSRSYLMILASIRSSEENDLITQFVSEATDPFDLWIGGRRIADGHPQWEWIDGSDFSYENFAVGEPNDMNGNEDHLEYRYKNNWNGNWNDQPKNSRLFGLYRKVLFQIGSSEFYVSKMKLNWNDHFEEAAKYEMVVSSIRSEEENDLIHDFIFNMSIIYDRTENESENHFWLGATRNSFHSNLEWVDGSIFDFQDLVFGDDGVKNCVSFQVDLGGWINSDCNNEYYAIYRKIKKGKSEHCRSNLDSWISFDVSELVNRTDIENGEVSFVVDTTTFAGQRGDSSVSFYSQNYMNGIYAPKLENIDNTLSGFGDTFVDSSSPTTTHNTNVIRVKSGGFSNAPTRYGLMKFELPLYTGNHSKFTLSLKLGMVYAADSRIVRVRRLFNSSSWDEDSATYSNTVLDDFEVGSSNASSIISSLFVDSTAQQNSTSGSWVNFDVTDLIDQNLGEDDVSFLLDIPSYAGLKTTNGVWFFSNENGIDDLYAPTLSIQENFQ